MFQDIQAAPPDAILGISEAFRSDSNPDKINLSVGVYQNSSGMTPKLRSVQQAETKMLEEDTGGGYLPIDGLPQFGKLVVELLLGADHSLIQQGRVATIQTPGGTGALRVAADFISRNLPSRRVWMPNPTWANHANIFNAAGLETTTYAYYNGEDYSLDFPAMRNSLEKIPRGDVVVLHACCHNPTGVDLDQAQWRQIASAIAEQGLLPIVDFAYQGFADGVDEDAFGVRAICELVPSALICNSFSKNISMYRERVGGLTAVAETPDVARAVLSQIKRAVRYNYSNPPYHGGAVVSRVLGDRVLRKQWIEELAVMRERIHEIRAAFSAKLNEIQQQRDFSFINSQRGMFSFSGLTSDQVKRLREEHSIYLVGDGRMNVAGMNRDNVEKVCQAVAAVL
jgi:aspartate aminotransferase/aromatic-amino-acid transaminase